MIRINRDKFIEMHTFTEINAGVYISKLKVRHVVRTQQHEPVISTVLSKNRNPI